MTTPEAYCAREKLQLLRDRIGKPLRINSSYRCAVHNKNVGGVDGSKHLEGIAFDISLRTGDFTLEEIRELAFREGWTGFGYYDTFIHLDDRDGRIVEWDYRTNKTPFKLDFDKGTWKE
ncbi:D-Ala-D-Ala carboxypeptidase family metallohydrolase [Magnetovibrio sp. PR-2]